jgi:hypothetical protein
MPGTQLNTQLWVQMDDHVRFRNTQKPEGTTLIKVITINVVKTVTVVKYSVIPRAPPHVS